MTVKSELYLALSNGSLNIREFQRRHPNVRVKEVGGNTTLIRFRESESWQKLDDFKSNYESKLKCDARDRVRDLQRVISDDAVIEILPDGIRTKLESSLDYFKLKEKFDRLVERHLRLQDDYQQARELLGEYKELVSEYESLRQ